MLESLPQIDEHPRNTLRLGESTTLDFRSGVYFDTLGQCSIRDSVRGAEQQLLNETSKDYLPLAGDPDFRQLVSELLGLPESPTLQAPGGSGALRWLAEFLHHHLPNTAVYVSTPTWGNHHKLFGDAEVPVNHYEWPIIKGRLDITAVCDSLTALPSHQAVLLHGCTHNPTGIDPTVDQWQMIGRVLKDRKALPILDFAFTGYGAAPEEEFKNLHTLKHEVDQLIVICSWSKTFGLYRERPGSITVVGPKTVANNISRHLEWIVRGLWSTPPAHGARVVATILNDKDLRKQWLTELAEIRSRLEKQRRILVEALDEHCPKHDWSTVRQARSLFAWLQLNNDVVNQLTIEHAIRVGSTGLVNLSCSNAQGLRHLAKAIGACLKTP